MRLNSPYRQGSQLISRETIHAFTAESGCARSRSRASPVPRCTPAAAQETKVGIGMSGWTGFAPLTLAKQAGIFKKNGLDVDHQEDPAEGPPSGDRLRRHPVRGHHGRDLGRVERQRRRHQADLPARQVLRRRRHGRAQRRRLDQGSQGQDGRRLRAGHRALLHAGLVPEEERPVGEGRDRGQPRARRRRAGLRRRPERRRHDLRALSVDRPRRPRQGQDHRHHARLSDDHGHLRLHAQVPGRQSQGRARRWPTATSRRST